MLFFAITFGNRIRNGLKKSVLKLFHTNTNLKQLFSFFLVQEFL